MEKMSDGGFILDKPEEIHAYRILALRSRLKLEVKSGMPFSSRGPATSTMVRETIGSNTRSKSKLLEEFDAWVEKNLGIAPKPM